MHAYKVPTHMAMPDRIVFGLTAKQLLITLIGCSLGYDIWLHLPPVLLTSGIVGLIARLGCSLVPAAMAGAVAVITVAGRPLDVWALVALRYRFLPRTYLWRTIRLVTPSDRDISQQHGHVVETAHAEKALKTPLLKRWKRG